MTRSAHLSKPSPSAKRRPSSAKPVLDAHIPTAGGSRKEARQIRSKETVSAILEAAACLLEETGFHSATTNAIARRAGVSIGSLYQYFTSREDIFRALLAEHQAAAHACVHRVLEPVLAGKRGPAKALPELLQKLVEMHRERPRLMRAMTTELAHLIGDDGRKQEAQEMEELVTQVAARLPGPPGVALAKSWMVAELTSQVSRTLVHEPPEYVDPAEIQAVFTRLVNFLLK